MIYTYTNLLKWQESDQPLYLLTLVLVGLLHKFISSIYDYLGLEKEVKEACLRIQDLCFCRVQMILFLVYLGRGILYPHPNHPPYTWPCTLLLITLSHAKCNSMSAKKVFTALPASFVKTLVWSISVWSSLLDFFKHLVSCLLQFVVEKCKKKTPNISV